MPNKVGCHFSSFAVSAQTRSEGECTESQGHENGTIWETAHRLTGPELSILWETRSPGRSLGPPLTNLDFIVMVMDYGRHWRILPWEWLDLNLCQQDDSVNNVESRWARGRTGCKGISYRAIAILFQAKCQGSWPRAEQWRWTTFLPGEVARLKLWFQPLKRLTLNLLLICWSSRCKKKRLMQFWGAWTM